MIEEPDRAFGVAGEVGVGVAGVERDGVDSLAAVAARSSLVNRMFSSVASPYAFIVFHERVLFRSLMSMFPNARAPRRSAEQPGNYSPFTASNQSALSR